MNKAALLHNAYTPMAYPVANDTLHVVVQTAREDEPLVVAHFGDRYNDEDHTCALRRLGADDVHAYYEADLKVETRRIRYMFEVRCEDQTVWLGESGVADGKAAVSPFQYPYIADADLPHVPDWVPGTVVYEIFPERFCNGDRGNDPAGTRDWDSQEPVERTSFYGGDLPGVQSKLGYLKELGVDLVYLTPVFTAPSNHKYDTVDYEHVDPAFGGDNALRSLADSLHRNGLKLMLDCVVNHSGNLFPPFQDVLRNGAKSVYRDWFRLYDFPVVSEPVPNYETFANNVATMPKLMTANPAVHDYLLGVIRKWTSELQLDGWRLDVCNEVDHAFWRDFRQTVRSINNQTFILGEIWHDAMPWLQGDQLDSVMNYLFRGVTLDFFAEGKFGPEKFGAQVNALLRRYPRYVTRGLLNLLGSHDTPRLMTVCGGDKRKARMATVFQFLYPGLPMIYCGDEIGMEGGPDPDCRRPMIWDERRQDREMLAMYRRLVELRHQAPWLSDVGFESLWSDDSIGVFAMRRFNPQGTGEILAVFNTSAEDRKVGVNCSSGTWVNAFTSGNYTVSGGHVDIAVEALGVTVLMRSDR